jgi:hypothetical protein
MNLLGSGAEVERTVIDSSPARVSTFGCPERYDPVNNFPKDASGLLVIAGEEDTVVPASDVRPLLELAESRGGQAVLGDDFSHPFMDSPQAHQRRIELIRTFLSQKE